MKQTIKNNIETGYNLKLEVGKWQTIATAPKDIDVLVTGGIVTQEVSYNGELHSVTEWDEYHIWESNLYMNGDWSLMNMKFKTKPTHWMPLPKPPKGIK